MMLRLAVIFLAATSLPAAPDGMSPGELLNRIRQKMADNLERLPNYTCRLKIERSIKARSDRRFELLDRLRLEVALAGRRELFAWPGQDKFEEKRIGQMVPAGGGVISTGEFALHARAIFTTRAPTFIYAGKVVQDGRNTIQFDFRVPRVKSAYQISIGAQSGIVGYHGSFWVDAETLDLIRLQVQADDIPSAVLVSAAEDMLEYQRVRIGDADFLLPRSSELLLVDADGNASRNRSEFSGCRQYSGQSVIRFTDANAGQEPVQRTVEIALRPGLPLQIELTENIGGDDLAIGDPVRGKLTHDLRSGQEVLFPKGATVIGHLTRVRRRHANIGEYWVVGMQLARLESPGRRSEFQAELEELRVGSNQFFLPFAMRPGNLRSPWSALRQLPPAAPARGEGVMLVKGAQLHIPAGLRMEWRTSDSQP